MLMFAACWIVFYKEHLRPVTGYFLWTASMVLALFSAGADKTPAPQAQKNIDNRASIS